MNYPLGSRQMIRARWAQPAPRKWAVATAAHSYVTQTEQYDRAVCTGPIIRGEILPADGHQMHLIGINARRVFAELLTQLQNQWPTVTVQDLRQAIAAHN